MGTFDGQRNGELRLIEGLSSESGGHVQSGGGTTEGTKGSRLVNVK